jgi:hypothetical protein
LDYDYIGATWPQFDDGLVVGNGGFSLRSRRLLHLLEDDIFEAHHPEDVAICRTWRKMLEEAHGIRFAPPELASTFSAERSGDLRETFGFHGFFNMPDILPLVEVKRMVAALPVGALQGIDGADFILRLAEGGHRGFAWRLLVQRLRTAGWGWRDNRLLHTLVRSSIRSLFGNA